MSIFDCCSAKKKLIIYLSGSKKNKEEFLQSVFNQKTDDISFSEYKVSVNGIDVYLQVVKDEEVLTDIDEMHLKMSNGVIMLRNKDEKVTSTKPTLFVLLDNNSIHESERTVIVKSVKSNELHKVKSCVEKLVEMIEKK